MDHENLAMLGRRKFKVHLFFGLRGGVFGGDISAANIRRILRGSVLPLYFSSGDT